MGKDWEGNSSHEQRTGLLLSVYMFPLPPWVAAPLFCSGFTVVSRWLLHMCRLTLVTLATQWIHSSPSQLSDFGSKEELERKRARRTVYGVEGIFHIEHFLKHSMWKGKKKGKEDGLQSERILHLANHFLKYSTWQLSSINKGNKGQCFRSLDWLFATFSSIFHWTWEGKQLEVWMNT